VQVKQALQQNAPGLEVLGSNYPPPPMSLLVARLVGAAQFFVIGVALAGDKLFSPPPPWAQSILRNKMNACAAAWFMGNMVHQNLMATGAFEVRERTVEPREVVRAPPFPRLTPSAPQVFYDGALVFSKLQSGMRPDLAFIVSEVLRRRADGRF
jgi:hypothetical protein